MVEVVSIDVNNPEMVSIFRRLARDYLKNLPHEDRERFIESILSKQGEADRWLLLLKDENEPAGFAHFKIDKDERLGWGFILEFYISPAKR
ncbi:MAG: GNAT family N-acetyltransferase [Candidatus Bathyarchaeia archaeon]